jgi:glutaredoxin-like YruB-family protein
MAQIKVFSTPTCSYCIRLKDYLREKNLFFDSVDVSGDEKGLEEMIRVSGQMGVPVIVIDGEVIVGFEKDKINAKLGL